MVASFGHRDAIVRVKAGGDFCGTAFFISPRTALTCHHVIKNLSRSDIRLVGPWSGAEEVALSEMRSHPDAGRHQGADLAVLEVDEPNRINKPPLKLYAGWPAEHDELTVYGYSTTKGPLEPRKFRVVAYDSAGGVFSMQNLAAKGISGGPVLDKADNVVGVACFISNRNLTYFIPISRLISFIREFPSAGLHTKKRFSDPWHADKLHAGLSSALGSLHLHIDGGEDRAIAETTARLIDPNYDRTEVATINDAIDGPQRKQRPDLYADHTPTQDGAELLHYFTTTTLHPGPEEPDSIQVAEIEDQVRQVLGRLTVEADAGTPAAEGGIVVEVERVVGAISADGSAKWVENPSLPSIFRQGFLFQKRGSQTKSLYEVHFSLDVPRVGADEPPLSLEMLLEACERAQVAVGGWFMFSKPDRWAYRSNAFLYDIDENRATVLRNALLQQVDRLSGLNLAGYTIRVLVEESLGVWKTRFERIDQDALTVPEIAAWERSRPPGSKVWVVTGNFLGDQNDAIEMAMLENLERNISYMYFLRSFADLNRWNIFRHKLEKKKLRNLDDQLVAFSYEFRDQEIWNKKLDCFIC